MIAAIASAADAPPALQIRQKTLKNGLRIVAAEDRSRPVINLQVWYHVGSKDEKPGRTGFAHLFEHLMFRGSKNVGPEEHMRLVRQAGGDVIGLDWRIDIGEARERLGDGVAVQGNLDPAALLAPLAVIEEKVRRLLARAGNRPGHIFNLGHGVHKETPVEHVAFLVEAVHRLSRRPLPAPAGE